MLLTLGKNNTSKYGGKIWETEYRMGYSCDLNQLHRLSIRDNFIIFSYLPTPPLGQDMTQGQFLSGV